MKTRNMVKLALCALFICVSLGVKAQVTIGSLEGPVKGALLDLKEHLNAPDSTTSTRGLVLPRVRLVSLNTLEPLISLSDSEWLPANQAQTKKEHIGVFVYNLTYTSPFSVGLYVWNGSIWTKSGAESAYIWMPSFDMPWNITPGTTLSVDLYAVYLDNLETGAATHNSGTAADNPTFGHKYVVSSGSTGAVHPFGETTPARTDLAFIITDYDDTVITDVAVSANGLLTYKTAVAGPPPSSAYVNIMLKKK
jgi:hypothetical protein